MHLPGVRGLLAAASRRDSSAAQGGAQNASFSNGQKRARLKRRAFILAGEFLLTFCRFEPEKPQV
jgi:hypothetical protein